MCLCLCKSVNTHPHLFWHMKGSMHVYGYICTHTNTHVPVWVCLYLCTFLHKYLGVSQNVPHEPPETSLCFCICVCVCTCVFASLRLWISKHIVWMAYIHLCVLLWSVQYGVYIYNYTLLCVYTQNCGHLCVTLYIHMCIHVYMKSRLLGLWMLCLYCANNYPWLWL